MVDTRYRLPNEVATHLDISPTTLRRWSSEFSDYLSDPAGRPESSSGGQSTHRRYTDEDLETLMTIKGLLAERLTYIQVGRRLEALRLRQQAASEVSAEDGNDGPVTTLSTMYQEPASYSPAVTVLSDTLHTVADGQQLLLGSQQANRELMTVLLQDNFTLKEENARLRDRMLELERDLAEIRRTDAKERELLEARFQELEDSVLSRPVQPARSSGPPRRPAPGPHPPRTERPPRPEPQKEAEDERPGCFARLLAPFR